jgi:hypothetical protein
LPLPPLKNAIITSIILVFDLRAPVVHGAPYIRLIV